MCFNYMCVCAFTNIFADKQEDKDNTFYLRASHLLMGKTVQCGGYVTAAERRQGFSCSDSRGGHHTEQEAASAVLHSRCLCAPPQT